MIIADEPTTALDATVQAQILDLLLRLQQESGTALIMITHDLGVVADIADDVMVMYAGRAAEKAAKRDVFYAPEAFRAPLTTEQVTKQAAEEFSDLATLLRRYGEEPQHIAHFLIRLLFCLFAEDIGLLPNGLFSRLISSTLP